MANKKRVLFLCTGNSARSQMAEGLLRQMAGDRFDVFSAGRHPKGLHPRSVEVMKEVAIDIAHHRSKDVSEYAGEKFDYVITVCDRAKQHCPVFPGAEPIHWGFDIMVSPHLWRTCSRWEVVCLFLVSDSSVGFNFIVRSI